MEEKGFKYLFPFIILLSFFTGCREGSGVESYVPPTVEINFTSRFISPVFASNWEMGSSYTIQWMPVNGVQTVDLLLYKKTEFIGVIAQGVSNTGLFSWLIPQLPYQSHHYMIKIVQSGTENVLLTSEHFYVLN